jgi:SAM-dependent methyltransferase
MRVRPNLLRCPVDAGQLRQDGPSLVCASSVHRFPVVDGVPVLIDDDTSVFTVAGVAARGSAAGEAALLRRIALRVRPTPSSNIRAASRLERFCDLACEGGRSARVLIVGGGELGHGMDAIIGDPRLETIETDVYISDRIDVACDAHRLPFVDGVFDGAVVQAVLEHVASPTDVVAEIHRVLRPGGLVYAETPFLQAVHEGAYDFTRFTDVGHRRLFRMFEEIDRGIALGPATSLLWAIRYFFRALPRRGGTAAGLLDFVVSCGLFWLVYLDRRLSNHAGAYDAASGLYFLGRRAETPVSDRYVVAGYRGTAGRTAALERGFRS